MIWQVTTTFTTIEELEDYCGWLKEHNRTGKSLKAEIAKQEKVRKNEQPKADAAEEFYELPEELKADPAEIFGEPKEKAPEIAFEDLRAELTQIARGGKNSEIQQIIKSKGASKLSEIDASLYTEVLEEARKLTA